MNIGAKIRELRLKNRMSRKELGELIGQTDDSIGKYERGEREPSFRTLDRLAKAFGVSTAYIVRGAEK